MQPSDPYSLKQGYDIVSSERLPKKSLRIKFIGFSGAVFLVVIWMFIGNYVADYFSEIFLWSVSGEGDFKYIWFCCMAGLCSLAWYTAKKLVSRKKWKDDPRRLY